MLLLLMYPPTMVRFFWVQEHWESLISAMGPLLWVPAESGTRTKDSNPDQMEGRHSSLHYRPIPT
ncbi:hypothetical protein HUJ04_011658 [Dendroctonus ponderosae]|nr:hypothetical protein HUJ04_011658 [Dendroctonus ponderosae]